MVFCFLDTFWDGPASTILMTVINSMMMDWDANVKTLDNLIIYTQISVKWREIFCLLMVFGSNFLCKDLLPRAAGISGNSVEESLAWSAVWTLQGDWLCQQDALSLRPQLHLCLINSEEMWISPWDLTYFWFMDNS